MRTADPTALRVPGAMGGAANSHGLWMAVRCMASASARKGAGMIALMLLSARATASSMPATLIGAVCRATATASAWSSSSNSGGSLPATPSR